MSAETMIRMFWEAASGSLDAFLTGVGGLALWWVKGRAIDEATARKADADAAGAVVSAATGAVSLMDEVLEHVRADLDERMGREREECAKQLAGLRTEMAAMRAEFERATAHAETNWMQLVATLAGALTDKPRLKPKLQALLDKAMQREADAVAS